MEIGPMIRRLYWDMAGQSAIVYPNFTPVNWWECDIFRVTSAGYFYEYEIKRTVADFRADRQKREYNWEERTYRSKHMALTQRDTRGPSRFFYVVPAELTVRVEEELPEWSGLIECAPVHGRVDLVTIRVVRKALCLHRVKISRARVRQAERSAVARYWDLYFRSFVRSSDLVNDIDVRDGEL